MQICLFDIDGTLLRSGGAGKAAMESALQETFNVALAAEQVSYSGRTDRAIGRDLFRLHGIDLNEANWQRFIDAYLHRLPACLVSMQGVVCPGIAELLDELATWPDIAVGLLTGNLPPALRSSWDTLVCTSVFFSAASATITGNVTTWLSKPCKPCAFTWNGRSSPSAFG